MTMEYQIPDFQTHEKLKPGDLIIKPETNNYNGDNYYRIVGRYKNANPHSKPIVLQSANEDKGENSIDLKKLTKETIDDFIEALPHFGLTGRILPNNIVNIIRIKNLESRTN